MYRFSPIPIYLTIVVSLSVSVFSQAKELPLSTRFKGEERFDQIVRKAQNDGWAKLPMGERMAKFAKELHGLPYTSFTLEIDDHIEAPSANMDGLDCWTFFEITLGLSRMIAEPKASYEPEDLLRQIEFTRYRGGQCTGSYLERIHYLAEWFFENDARGVADNITKDLGPTQLITGRKCQEMTVLWNHYRYLRENPDLRPSMTSLESQISKLPVRYLPEANIRAAESKLQNGDIVGIVTKHTGGFCSHVGIVYTTNDGVKRLMHASSQQKYRRVVIDSSVSDYIKTFSGHIGIIVARPNEVESTITDGNIYRTNLKKLTGMRLISMIP